MRTFHARTVIRGPRRPLFALAALAGLLISSTGVLVGALAAGRALSRPERPTYVVVNVPPQAPPACPPPPEREACAPCQIPVTAIDLPPQRPTPADEAPRQGAFSCRAPFEGAPFEPTPEAEDDAEEPPIEDGQPPVTERFAVSRAAFGVIAVWTRDAVALSRDDGQTFQVVEGNPDVVDVAVGARGTVFILRDGALQLISADGRVERRALPCFVGPLAAVEEEYGDEELTEPWIAVDGGYLAVHCQPRVGPLRIALSRDEGLTWTRRTAPSEEYGVSYAYDGATTDTDVAIDRSGRLTLLERRPDGEGGTYGQLWRSRSGRGAWLSGLNLTGNAGLGPDGTTYFASWGCEYLEEYEDWEGFGLGAVDRQGRCRRIFQLPESFDLYVNHFLVARNDSQAFGVLGRQLYRLGPQEAELIAEDVPEGLSGLALDSCGRLLGLWRGRVLRRTPGSGWRVVYSWPAPSPADNDNARQPR